MWLITLSSLFASTRDRALARDEARYAWHDHGEKAEARLRRKAKHSPSRERRRIYKLAIAELAKIQRSD